MFDPPYVPLGPSAPPAKRDRVSCKTKSRGWHRGDGIATGEYDPGDTGGRASTDTAGIRNHPNSPGLELFYTKDVFTCQMDGKPNWCSYCANWKPDRAHHCSSSGRCVYKMDHFCPWVGGIIGEDNFKFFIQFNGYSVLYCIHLLVVMAIYVYWQKVIEVWLLQPFP
jgi:palmitoyltransferase